MAVIRTRPSGARWRLGWGSAVESAPVRWSAVSWPPARHDGARKRELVGCSRGLGEVAYAAAQLDFRWGRAQNDLFRTAPDGRSQGVWLMGLAMSVPQLLIILVIVALIFGTKRLKEVGGDLGSAIKSFRKAMATNEQEQEEESRDPKQLGNNAAAQTEKRDQQERQQS